MDLQEARVAIDRVDAELLRLFEERMDLSARIAAYKAANGLPVRDPAREAEKLDAVGARAQSAYRLYARRLFGELFALSRDYQCAYGQTGRAGARNIALIGMPGCGKTSVGRCLAALAGRPFFDTDEMVAAREGMAIPALFAARGEAYFRDCETCALAEAANGAGAVIATGGGAVTRARNRDILRESCVILQLTRPLRALALEGRPLTQKTGAEELYRVRKPLYDDWSEKTYANVQIEQTARQICADWL